MDKVKFYEYWFKEDGIPTRCDICDDYDIDTIRFQGEDLCITCFNNLTFICKQCGERDWKEHRVNGLCINCQVVKK